MGPFRWISAIIAKYPGFLIFLCFGLPTSLGGNQHSDHLIIDISGDINIGVLFKLQDMSKAPMRCNRINQGEVYILEALNWTLSQINSMGILPNGTRIGVKGYNICLNGSEDSHASIRDLQITEKFGIGKKSLNESVVAVTGQLYSKVVLDLLNQPALSTPQHLPIISSDATDSFFSNRNKYPFVARTVPSDESQAGAIKRLIQQFPWIHHVVLVTETIEFPSIFFNQFKSEFADDEDLCIVASNISISNGHSLDLNETIRQIEEVMREKEAQAMVLLMGVNTAKNFLYHLKNTPRDSLIRKIQIFGPDNWSGDVVTFGVEDVLNGSVLTSLWSEPVKRFHDHLAGATLGSTYNYWLRQEIAIQNHCDLNTTWTARWPGVPCKADYKLVVVEDRRVHYFVEALDLLARAIAATVQKGSMRDLFNYTLFMDTILNTHFNDSLAEFDFFQGTNGGLPKFSLNQWRPVTDHPSPTHRFDWFPIGYYDSGATPDIKVDGTTHRFVKTFKKGINSQCPKKLKWGEILRIVVPIGCGLVLVVFLLMAIYSHSYYRWDGQIIKRFRDSDFVTREQIGRGNYGEVWKVETRNGKIYARKTIKAEIWERGNPREIESTENLIFSEAILIRRLKHKNIVRIIGLCMDVQPYAVIMELLDIPLDKWLKQESRDFATVKELADFSLHLVNALIFLQKEGLVHNDVAARNCLTKRNNLKLADFGLSREVGTPNTDAEPRSVIGSPTLRPPFLSAPEIHERISLISTKNDVFLLASTLWEIFTLGNEAWKEPCMSYVVGILDGRIRDGAGRRVPLNIQLFVDACQALPTESLPDPVRGIISTSFSIDRDNRPTFSVIAESLRGLAPWHQQVITRGNPADAFVTVDDQSIDGGSSGQGGSSSSGGETRPGTSSGSPSGDTSGGSAAYGSGGVAGGYAKPLTFDGNPNPNESFQPTDRFSSASDSARIAPVPKLQEVAKQLDKCRRTPSGEITHGYRRLETRNDI